MNRFADPIRGARKLSFAERPMARQNIPGLKSLRSTNSGPVSGNLDGQRFGNKDDGEHGANQQQCSNGVEGG
jgi:hypothetical protein